MREKIKSIDAVDIDSAYRQLAAATVVQALYDYAYYLYKPDFADEIKVCRDQIDLIESVDKVLMLSKYGKNFEAYATIVEDLFLKFRGLGETYYRIHDNKVNTAAKEKLERATKIGELREVLSSFKGNFEMRERNFEKRGITRKAEANRIERFVADETMEFYSNGLVSKTQFFNRAREIAESWKKNGVPRKGREAAMYEIEAALKGEA